MMPPEDMKPFMSAADVPTLSGFTTSAAVLNAPMWAEFPNRNMKQSKK